MNDQKVKILFVEDDMSLGLVTKDSLRLQGYEVKHFDNGQAGWEAFQKENFDLCILDVMLPKMDGFTLARGIRKTNQDIPILFLTAKTLEEDKIEGLKIGADDYMTKPFNIEELMLKIRIFLKRSKVGNQIIQNQKFVLGDFELDFENLILKNNLDEQQLTMREAEVLRFFCQNTHKILKREEILKAIWGEDDYFMGRSLDVFIARLRKYLKNDARIKIENIPGVGFKISVKN